MADTTVHIPTVDSTVIDVPAVADDRPTTSGLVTGLTFAAASVFALLLRGGADLRRDHRPVPDLRPAREALRLPAPEGVPPGLLTDLTHLLVNNVLTPRARSCWS